MGRICRAELVLISVTVLPTILIAADPRDRGSAAHLLRPSYLKRTVPRLGFVRRTILGSTAPFLFGTMSRLMCFPPTSLVRTYGVPRSQLRRELRSGAGRQLLRDSVAKPRKLCAELGLMNPVERCAWRLMGIWDEDAAVRSTNARDGRGDTTEE
jgi:hypothetical protein